MREKCSSRAIAPGKWVIPTPSPSTVAMFHNTNRNASAFLKKAGITEGSKEHKDLLKTVRELYHQYLHPFKYLEEQAPDRVDQLVEKARITLPWLNKYEDGWPARIYLKRYVDTRRPHLQCTRSPRRKQMRTLQSEVSCTVVSSSLQLSGNLEGPSDLPKHDFTVRDFLRSLTPSLEHRLDAFVQLGIKDQETLRAFLSWPQCTQAQFLDDGNAVLQLTSLERKALLLGCSCLAQRALQDSESLARARQINVHP